MARLCTPLFVSHINPPASLARLRQPIIGTGGNGVLLPSLVLRREQDDVTTDLVAKSWTSLDVPCPSNTRRNWASISARRGARAAAASQTASSEDFGRSRRGKKRDQSG